MTSPGHPTTEDTPASIATSDLDDACGGIDFSATNFKHMELNHLRVAANAGVHTVNGLLRAVGDQNTFSVPFTNDPGQKFANYNP
jgi:hypothetical protein